MNKKICTLAKMLPDGFGALIVSPVNRLYFTGFSSSLGYLLITKNSASFLTDSRYIENAQKNIDGVNVKEFFSIDSVCNELKSLNVKKILMQSSETTVAEARHYKNKFGDCEPVFDDRLDEIISELRAVKDDSEKEYIIKAQRIAEDAFTNVLGIIKEGITEKQIALELDFYMLSHGAEALSFETIAVSGSNSSLPHGVPTEKKIECGDFITMDFGAVYMGYHSDMTRTVAIGKVSDEQKKVYDTVLKAQKAALDGISAGIKCSDGDRFARLVIENAGYGRYFRHSTGHGVGVEIHEAPNLSPNSTNILKSGTVVTVEPGIYLPGKFGVRIEDMVIVTENGCENITKSEKKLIIL